MICQTLTLKSIQARPVVLKLKRPVAARIATLIDWPLILIDLYTEEGVIGGRVPRTVHPQVEVYLIPPSTIVYHTRAATCTQRQLKALTIMVESQNNGWRIEDVWLEREVSVAVVPRFH